MVAHISPKPAVRTWLRPLLAVAALIPLVVALALYAVRPAPSLAAPLLSCPDPLTLLPPGAGKVDFPAVIPNPLPLEKQDEVGLEATYDGGSLDLQLTRYKTPADAAHWYGQVTGREGCGPAGIGERSEKCSNSVYFMRGRYIGLVANVHMDPLSAHALDMARQLDAAIQAIPASQNGPCNTGTAPGTATPTSAAPAAPFSVGNGCGYSETNAPGELRCAAFVSNASANPVIAYQWTIDGQAQPEKGNMLVRNDAQITAGAHTVTVTATDSGANPPRKTQTNTFTFTKPGVAAPKVAPTRTNTPQPTATPTRATAPGAAPQSKSGSKDAGVVRVPDGVGGFTEVPAGGKATVSLPQDGKASVEAVCKNADYTIALMEMIYDTNLLKVFLAVSNGRPLNRGEAIIFVLGLTCDAREGGRIEPKVPGNAALLPPGAGTTAARLSVQLQGGPMRFDLQRKDIALDVSTPLGVVVSQGQNSFGVGYDGLSGNLLVEVYGGSVELQPANSSQRSRTLTAGDGVQVTKDGIKALAGMGEGKTVDASSAGSAGVLCGCGVLLLIPIAIIFVLLRRRSKKRRGRVPPVTVPPVSGPQASGPQAGGPQPTSPPAQNPALPTARRFCIHCGAPIEQGARFCGSCGQPSGG
jgi:hypothetical protein